MPNAETINKERRLERAMNSWMENVRKHGSIVKRGAVADQRARSEERYEVTSRQ